MTTPVDIVNAALIRLGEAPVASLLDDAKAARLARALYDDVRDAVIRAHPWNSAITRAVLAEASGPPAWGFAHTYPLPAAPDYCLRVLAVEGEDELGGRWKVEGRAIVTDLPPPIRIVYLSRLENPGLADPLLREALVARLSRELAEPLGKSTSLQQAMDEIYQAKLGEARSIDGQEGTPGTFEGGSWIAARQ